MPVSGAAVRRLKHAGVSLQPAGGLMDRHGALEAHQQQTTINRLSNLNKPP